MNREEHAEGPLVYSKLFEVKRWFEVRKLGDAFRALPCHCDACLDVAQEREKAKEAT